MPAALLTASALLRTSRAAPALLACRSISFGQREATTDLEELTDGAREGAQGEGWGAGAEERAEAERLREADTTPRAPPAARASINYFSFFLVGYFLMAYNKSNSR